MIHARGQLLAHYELLEELGRGAMGEVWRARDTRLDRQVAVKLLPESLERDPQRLARLEREARAVAALNHANIVTVYSVEEAEGTRFLTMELVEGSTLAELIPQGGLPTAQLLDVAVPLADALATAHERGIIHRDLKPGNVMVGPRGQVKILDFGMAVFREPGPLVDANDAQAATREQGLSGTLGYMSPEQVRGGPLDHRSDLFSLGVMLFEMATGLRPFLGQTPADMLAAILRDTPPPVCAARPELPRALGHLIAHCLEKDPRRRLQSAADLRKALERLRRPPAAPPGEVLPSVAVLPFLDLSRDRDQDYFCRGVAEEILNALTRLRSLKVASRSSAFQYRGAERDTREVGERLGVAAVLEGSVRKAGRRLRITVQLIDVASGYHRWSEQFDRDVDDVFAIQDEIARSVAAALQINLGPGERQLLGKPPTSDVQAYDYYLRGRHFYYQYSRRDMEFAVQLFSRAIERDPQYARAHAGMADCYSFLYMYADGGEACRDQAERSSRKALELDPGLAEAHASHGVALSLHQRDAQAEAAFEQAIRLDPRLFEAHYFYARHCFVRGQLQKAAALYEQAGQARPEDFQSPLLVAQIYEDLGRKGDADAARRRGIGLAEEHLKLNPDDVRALYMVANGLVALGEVDRGLQWLDRAMAIGTPEAMLLYNAGCIKSMAGRLDDALDCLERAVDTGLAQRRWFLHDNNLDPLRQLPRFEALMKRLEQAERG